MRAFLHLAFHIFLAFHLVLVLAGDFGENVPARYFPMPPNFSYLDGHFSQPDRLSNSERHEALVRTVRQFLSTMKEIKITVWLAHGALLGWYWGQKVLPWDTDIDVHVHIDDLRFLAAYYNMTLYKDEFSAEYLLEVNPNFLERSRSNDPDNIIDARWIDMTTGLFIDITAVLEIQKESEKEAWHLLVKDGHYYRKDTVLPLKKSKFEMEEVYIPRHASVILAHEYGKDALSRTTFRGSVVSLVDELLD
jgi:LicD family